MKAKKGPFLGPVQTDYMEAQVNCNLHLVASQLDIGSLSSVALMTLTVTE